MALISLMLGFTYLMLAIIHSKEVSDRRKGFWVVAHVLAQFLMGGLYITVSAGALGH